MTVYTNRFCGNCSAQFDPSICKFCSTCGTCLGQFMTPLDDCVLTSTSTASDAEAALALPTSVAARAPAFHVTTHAQAVQHCHTLPATTAPLLPTASVSAETLDDQTATKGWCLYIAGWVLSFACSPAVGLAVWILVSATFYCQPVAQRAAKPRQRRVAQAALITCNAVVLLALVFCIVWLGYHHRQVLERLKDFHWPHGRHHHIGRNRTVHTRHGDFLDW